MRESLAPKISKWPFFLGDALLLGLAGFIHYESKTPTGTLEMLISAGCVALGAWLTVIPFLKQYQAEVKLSESDHLASVVSQIQSLDQLAAQIGYATSQWQVIRESADKTAGAARDIAQGMAAEVKSFNEFLQKSNEGEKSTLRLEVEKLRRAEMEWLQVVVRMLDHVFALHQAALRSRQPGIAEQLGKFQAACHDAARRMGLAPFVAAPEEPFQAERHQLIEGPDARVPEGARVGETVAAGYTFQGRLIRPSIVRLQRPSSPEPAAEASAAPGNPAESTGVAGQQPVSEAGQSELL